MTTLERARLLHEDLEKLMSKLATELNTETRLQRERVYIEHQVKADVERYVDSAQKLLEIYQDGDGSRKQELTDLATGNLLSSFYERLQETRNYHRRFANNFASLTAPVDDSKDTQLHDLVKFTGEENYGKYLDMHNLFESYVNLPHFKTNGPKPSYVSYLGKFHELSGVPRASKMLGAEGRDYQKYIQDLLQYLIGYHQRVFPLVNTTEVDRLIEADFEARWNANGQSDVPGWVNAVDELKSGMGFRNEHGVQGTAEDRFHQGNPLWCTFCQKLFSKATVYAAHLPGKKHQHGVAAQKQNQSTAPASTDAELLDRSIAKARSIALIEEKIARYTELLEERIAATQGYIERKQTWTEDERLAEMYGDTEEIVEEEDDEDKDAFINYKNVPLGWDGKPIPYWLYKLHGLNLEFKCEICGNYSYWGPRAYERHFQEARHTFGLKILGIPNTKQFHLVTKIEDARALHAQMQKVTTKKEWKPEEEEEFEDADGRVFNKKTYDDLKRQGLLQG